MSAIFTLIHFGALICFFVFLIKMLKQRKEGLDYSNSKKIMLIAIPVWFISLIIIGMTYSPSDSNQNAQVVEETKNAESKIDNGENNASDLNEDSIEKQEENDDLTGESQGDEAQEEAALIIDIKAGEKGEYGQDIVLNEGTDLEDKTIAYFVPVGKYLVKNVGSYMSQINVYKNEINVVDGWEEWADGYAELLDVNATKEITVEEGYFINVDEPAHFEMSKIE